MTEAGSHNTVKGGDASREALLLVDDDFASRLTLSVLLEGEGYRVDTAESCAAARARLSSASRYAAVVLDGQLPDGFGWDLVPSIRASLPSARVMLVSGKRPTDAHRTLVDAWVVKGTAFPVLNATLRQMLGR